MTLMRKAVLLSALWATLAPLSTYVWAVEQELPEERIPNGVLSRYLAEKKFSNLEREVQGYINAYKKRQITAEELFDRFKPFTNDNLGLESLFNQWVDQYPKSYVARTARGIFFNSVAWSLRGKKFARDTTGIQFENFRAYLNRADADLRASLELDDKPIQSYTILIDVEKGLGTGETRKFVDDAIKLDPKAYRVRDVYLRSISPKWGGSFRLLDEFVAEAKSSPMLAEEKRHLEAEANWLKGDQAQLDQDYKAAIDYFRKSYTLYPKQVWRLDNAAGAALAGNMKDEALKILSEVLLADPKEAWALNKRGYLYEAYVQDNSKAFKDYVTAADAGNRWSQNGVGLWYLSGTAVTKNSERAEAYFRLAAAQGNENAKGNLKALLETKRSASK
jgi:hypothetical protein